MKKISGYIISITVLALMLIFSVSTCRKNANKNQNLQGQLSYLNQSYDSLKNKKNQVVIEQEVITVVDDKQLKELSTKYFDLLKKDEKHIKEIQTLVTIKQKVKIDTLYIPLTDGTDVVIKPDSFYHGPNGQYVHKDCVIIPPKDFSYSDSFYSISGKVLLNSVKLNPPVLEDSLHFRIATQDKGLFSKSKTVIQAIHTNPYIKTEGINSIVVEPRRSFFSRVIIPALTFIAGYFLTK
jgi:hypothetical protein